MKKIYIVIGLLCCFGFAQMQAQNEIIWGGDHIIKEEPSDFGGFVCHDQDGIVLWHTKMESLVKRKQNVSYFESYSPDLKLIASVPPPESFNGASVQFLKGLKIGGKIFALFLGNSQNKLALMAWPMDRKTLQMKGEPVHLFDIDAKFPKKGPSYGLRFFRLNYNSDSSKLAIVFPFDNYKSIHVGVFDQDLLLVWGKDHSIGRDISLEWSTGKLALFESNIIVTYSASMNKEESAISGQKGNNNGAYHAIIFRDNGSKIQDAWIDLGKGCFPVNLEVISQENGIFRCIGAYTENQQIFASENMWDARPIRGIFDCRIGADGKILGNPSKSEILPMLLKNKIFFEKETELEYSKPELKRFVPISAVNASDNTFKLIFEYNHFALTQKGLIQNTTTGDIMVVKVGNNGNILWANIIPNAQLLSDQTRRPYTSHGFFQQHDNLHFIYWEDTVPKSTCSWSTINEKGEVTKKEDWLKSGQNRGIMPSKGIYSNKSYLMPALKDKVFQLGLINL